MQNVKIDKKGDILTITVDLSKNAGPSKSGKSIVIASTQGNVAIVKEDAEDDHKSIYLGLNVYSTR